MCCLRGVCIIGLHNFEQQHVWHPTHTHTHQCLCSHLIIVDVHVDSCETTAYGLCICDSFNFCLSLKTINPSFNMKCLPPLAATSQTAVNEPANTKDNRKKFICHSYTFLTLTIAKKMVEMKRKKKEEEEDAVHYFRLHSRLHNMWSKNFSVSTNA